LILNQILPTRNIINIRRIVGRKWMLILGLKGLSPVSLAWHHYTLPHPVFYWFSLDGYLITKIHLSGERKHVVKFFE